MRAIYLLFATLCYAIFFATFLYLIAFTGNLPLVPRTVDFGPAAPAATAVIIDLALIALFGLQHSLMARRGFKAATASVVPAPVERSLYVLASSLVLILLFEFWRPLPAPVWTVGNPVVANLLWAVFALGWALVLLSTFLINHFELFGLQQVWLNLRGRVAAPAKFRTPFLYRLVRHPLYSGFILALWATPAMTVGHLLFAAGMSAYILLAIPHEERDLVHAFGDEYDVYRSRVGKLVPRLKR